MNKRTLRTYWPEIKDPPVVTATELIELREHLQYSRGMFARYLRVNARTLEAWEQGRAKPNPQAALLIRMASRFPDTLTRLSEV